MNRQKFYPGDRVTAPVGSSRVPAEVQSARVHDGEWLYVVTVMPGYLNSTYESRLHAEVEEAQIQGVPRDRPWPPPPFLHDLDLKLPEDAAAKRRKTGLGCLVALAAFIFLAGTGAGLWLGAAVSFASRVWP